MISHALSVDDTILFEKIDKAEANTFLRILTQYGKSSGQRINSTKSCVPFSKYTIDVKREVLQTLNMGEMDYREKYLGLLIH